MIVPEHIVKKWYRHSSPVYKNFAYFFQNELWSTPIPKGFSVCPFFWLAVFSFVAVRPFVFLLHCVLLPLLVAGGRPLRWINQKMLAAWEFFFPDTGLKRVEAGGLLVALAVIVAGFVTLLLTLLAWDFYVRVAVYSAPAMVLWWSVLSLIVLTLSVEYYKYRYRKDKAACKAHAWYYVWAGLTLLSFLVFCPTQVWALVSAIAIGIALGIWYGLYYFVAYGLYYTIWGIGYGLYYAVYGIGWFLWHALVFLWTALTYPWAYGIPWWVYVIGIPALLGYLSKKLFDVLPASWFETKIIPIPTGPRVAEGLFVSEADKADIRRIKISAWLQHIRHMANAHKAQKFLRARLTQWTELFVDTNTDKGLGIYEKLAGGKEYGGLTYLIADINDKLMDTFWRPLVEKIVDAGVEIPTGPIYWGIINRSDSATEKMGQLIGQIRLKNPDLSPEINNTLSLMAIGFSGQKYLSLAVAYTRTDEFYKVFMKIDKEVVEKRRLEDEKRLRRENSELRAWCRKVTGAILDAMEKGIDAGVALATLVGKGIAAPFKLLGICARQVGTFLVYVCILIKAKKQGACPYWQFVDDTKPTQPPAPPANDEERRPATA